jgi:hypothetical protein
MSTRRAISLGYTKSLLSSQATHKLPVVLPTDIAIEEERKQGYNPDHYYPVHIGEVFHGTYQVAAKLGYGGHSTVWLAQDTHRFVSIPQRQKLFVYDQLLIDGLSFGHGRIHDMLH